MPIIQQHHLIGELADGRFHTGEELGGRWQVSRAAISKAVKKLAHLGLDVHSVRGKGYRLSERLCLLNKASIYAELDDKVCHGIETLEIFPLLDSTNTYLLERVVPDLVLAPGSCRICLSEMQAAGRGRRGREWVSPFGYNIYLSLLKEFHHGVSAIDGLSLVVGLAIVRVLKRFDIAAGVKWPNDVLVNNRKLAGILIELRGDPVGGCFVVIGVGLNLRLAREHHQSIAQPAITLADLGFDVMHRNKLVAALIQEVIEIINIFQSRGFASFQEEWDSVDAAKGQQLVVAEAGGVIEGVGGGVDTRGALLVSTANGVKSINSGDVSLRLSKSPLEH